MFTHVPVLTTCAVKDEEFVGTIKSSSSYNWKEFDVIVPPTYFEMLLSSTVPCIPLKVILSYFDSLWNPWLKIVVLAESKVIDSIFPEAFVIGFSIRCNSLKLFVFLYTAHSLFSVILSTHKRSLPFKFVCAILFASIILVALTFKNVVILPTRSLSSVVLAVLDSTVITFLFILSIL
mgnify:CR=1 FL=1